MEEIKIGIFGGSGLYSMEKLKNRQEIYIETPFGKTSDAFITGEINGVRVAFMARHGRSHSLLPSEVPYKANIFAMKKLGVRYLLSVSAVGSLREEIKPCDIVIANQYIDQTKQRDMSFFGKGIVAHVSMAQPTCSSLNEILMEGILRLRDKLLKEQSSDLLFPKLSIQTPVQVPALSSIQATNLISEKIANNDGREVAFHLDGTYVCIEGPQFSSFAESQFYRQMGADVVGMTNMPEAKLAMEAQIAYSSLAMVTDYDCWHLEKEAVNVNMALMNLRANGTLAQEIIQEVVKLLTIKQPVSLAHSALSQSLVTSVAAMNDEQKELIQILLK